MLPEPDFELINSPTRNVLNNSDNVAISGNASTISFNPLDMNFDDQATIGQNIQEQPASKSANTVRGDDDGLASAPETPRTPTKKESISSKPAKLSSASLENHQLRLVHQFELLRKMDQLLALNQSQKPLTNRRNHSKETRFQTIKYEMVEFHQAPDQSINSIILVWFLFLHSILMLLLRIQMKTKMFNTSLVKSKSKSITIAIIIINKN